MPWKRPIPKTTGPTANATKPCSTFCSIPAAGRKKRSGSLSVETRPEGLTLLVDGTTRGRTPITLDLPAGRHVLAIQTARGTTLVPVTIQAGARKVERLDLRAALRARRGEKGDELRPGPR